MAFWLVILQHHMLSLINIYHLLYMCCHVAIWGVPAGNNCYYIWGKWYNYSIAICFPKINMSTIASIVMGLTWGFFPMSWLTCGGSNLIHNGGNTQHVRQDLWVKRQLLFQAKDTLLELCFGFHRYSLICWNISIIFCLFLISSTLSFFSFKLSLTHNGILHILTS